MISLFCKWYERKDDLSPDYDKVHYGNIHGDTPADCMNQLKASRENHDLSKYTPIEIVSVY